VYTDALFYELFRVDPSALFQLLNLDLEGDYAFDSVTIKTTEKRIDGLFRRKDGKGPWIFLEVQGYRDKKLYWRLFREIATCYEQEVEEPPFIAIALFLDESYKPTRIPLACRSPSRLIVATLEDALTAIGDTPGVLNVLKPLLVEDLEEAARVAPTWVEEILGLGLPLEQERRLIELLTYAILQKFPILTHEEVDSMLQLTPLEETRAVKELIAMGEKRGERRGEKRGEKRGERRGEERGKRLGEKRGEIIGSIRMCQRFLGIPISTSAELAGKSLRQLAAQRKALLARVDGIRLGNA